MVAVGGFSVMDNHLHVLLRLDPDLAQAWSDEEVVRRWGRLFPPRDKSCQPMPVTQRWIQWRLQDPQWIATVRGKLRSLSWFMKCLKEPLSRLANRQDKTRGTFFENRFKSVGKSSAEFRRSCNSPTMTFNYACGHGDDRHPRYGFVAGVARTSSDGRTSDGDLPAGPESRRLRPSEPRQATGEEPTRRQPRRILCVENSSSVGMAWPWSALCSSFCSCSRPLPLMPDQMICARKGYFGVAIRPTTAGDREKQKLKDENGVIVDRVLPDSSAALAGIQTRGYPHLARWQWDRKPLPVHRSARRTSPRRDLDDCLGARRRADDDEGRVEAPPARDERRIPRHLRLGDQPREAITDDRDPAE